MQVFQVGVILPIRVDHTDFFQVVIKTHSFILFSSQIKQDRLKSLNKTIWQPPPPHPSSHQTPTTVGYFRFL